MADGSTPGFEGGVLAARPPITSMRFRRMLREAAAETGRSRGAILGDWVWRYFMPRWMLLDEYLRFGLHRPGAAQPQDRAAFVGHWQNQKFNLAFNRGARGQRAYMTNKRIFGAVLEGFGLKAPRLQAMVHGALCGREAEMLRDAGAVADWLRHRAQYPLFGKPLAGSGSEGALSVDGLSDDGAHLRLIDGRQVDIARLADEIVRKYGDTGYMLMDRLRPHADLRRMAGETMGCIRLVTLTQACVARPHYAIWKVPAAGAVADNFWRGGNMLALLDVGTGAVLSVVQGAALTPLTHHPHTGAALVGQHLPMWDEVLRAGCEAAEIMPAMGLIGWDIAITDAGPVIVEGNGNPDHRMYQSASGTGFLDATRRGLMAQAVARQETARRADRARRRAALRLRKISDIPRVLEALHRDDPE